VKRRYRDVGIQQIPVDDRTWRESWRGVGAEDYLRIANNLGVDGHISTIPSY
jgi:hypothetical protein